MEIENKKFNTYQKKYQVIDDIFLLKLIHQYSHIDKDDRATWIAPGIPYTHCKKYKLSANWAFYHWIMYEGFLNLINFDNAIRFLDVGCGTGYATKCLSSIYPKIFIDGLDISKNSIKFANKYNNDVSLLKYINVDFLVWNSNGIKYDYIFALEILEHINPKFHYEFIDKCLSLLTTNGLLFVTTPNGLEEKDFAPHCGLLNRKRALEFINKYKKNIVIGNFYDNEELKTLNPSKYIIKEPIEAFNSKDNRNRSHFRIVMK